MGQSSSSIVLSVMKTEVPLDCDDPVNQDLLLQQYGERIERPSQQDKLSKFCMDAGFLSVVENGQYFKTKDTADLSQFHAVACREYTLPREEEASQPKGWIQGNTHSGRNPIDPTLQDNVVIPNNFFDYIYHIGCAVDLHSIINNGLIPGGQNSSKRQTVVFLPVDPRDKKQKDPEKIDLNVPRRAQYLQNAWKKHQDAVFWVDIDLAIRKGLTFYQTRSNAIILQGTLPAYCIPKVVRLKTGEVLYEKAYMSPRAPPKISLRHDWARGEVPLGSTINQQSEGEVVRQSQEEVARRAKFFQPTQPIPKPICDRPGQPDNTQGVFVVKSETSRSQEIDVKSFHEKLCSSDRSGQPDITQDVIRAQTNLSGENKNIGVEQTHDRSGQPDKRSNAAHHEIKMLNTDNELIRERIEVDIDFKKSASVRELIQKIENHPNRHALQRDLQQSQSFNPFSQESKQMIHEVGNIELCELLDTEPKTQCKVCSSNWDIGIVYCTCGHFLRNGTEENKKLIQLDLLSIPDYYIKKGRPHGHRYGKKPGDKGIRHCPSTQEEVQKEVLRRYPRSIYTR